MNIRRNEAEYVECDLVTIEVQIVKSEYLRYLDALINKDGERADFVTHRIKLGVLKWRGDSGVVCDWRIPTNLRGKLYEL